MPDALDFLDPDLAEQEKRLARRQAYANALLQGGMGNPGAAPGAGLRTAGQAILGGFLTRRADKQEATLGQQRAAALARILGGGGGSPQVSNAPQSIPGQPDLDTQSVGAPSPQISNTPAAGGGGGPDMRRLALAMALSGGDPKGLIEAQNYRSPEALQALRTQGAIETAQGSREPIPQAAERAGAVTGAEEAAKGTFRSATPDEIAQRGLPQGTTGQINSVTGEFKRDFTPLQPEAPKSPERQKQDLDAALAGRTAEPYQAVPNPLGSKPYVFNKLTGQFENQPSQGQGATPDLHGADFLKTLPPEQAMQVKALAEGRQDFPKGMSYARLQPLIAAVGQYDPSFDAINYSTRSKTRADFTGGGKDAQTLNRLETAIGHAGHLLDQIPATASHGGFPGATTVNAVQNYLAQSSGAAGPVVFKDTASKLAQELTAVYRGGPGAERDVVRGLQSLDVNASDEQKRAILTNAVDLLESKLEQEANQYNQGMNTTHEPLTFLHPQAQKVWTKLKGSPPDVISTPAPNVGPAPSAANAGAPARIQGDDDYNKLPSGTTFIGPDGVPRKKP